MSVDMSINIKLKDNNSNKINVVTFLKDLISSGWNLINDNRIIYLPIGDDGDYDWSEDNMTIDNFFNIVKVKEENNEVIGIMIKWKESEIGGNLLIYSTSEIIFSICVNRKKIRLSNNDEMIDINWYVEKLILPLKRKNYMFESFSYEEY